MRKTVEEHNNAILHSFLHSLQDYRMLSLDEASELNKKYLKTKDPQIKEQLLCGVQHFIYSFITLSDVQLGDQSVVDMDDIISYINLYLAEGIESGLFCDARILFTNGIKDKFETLDDLINLSSEKFRIDLVNYKLFNLNAEELKSSKSIFSNSFLRDFYTYIASGKIYADSLSQIKETESCDSIEDLYADTPEQLSFDLLEFLDANDLLVTKDIYEEFFFGDKAVKSGKRRKQDFFLTDSLSSGELFKVVRSHPMFKEFRDRYKAL